MMRNLQSLPVVTFPMKLVACLGSYGRSALLACLVAWTVTAVSASDATLIAGLSTSDHEAAGLQKLEPAQLAELYRQIELELTLAREGNVRAFAGSFSRRRNDADRAASGLGLLTPVEIALIDAHVAQRMARPVFATWSPRARTQAEVETVSNKPEIHGSISLFYGAGGGSSYRGASTTMTYDDPARNLSISVTYSRVSGSGYRDRYVTRRSQPDGP